MKIHLEPTEEIYDAPINETKVPVRIWHGFTENGIDIEAYVLSITPDNPADVDKLRAELPAYFKRSRDAYKIGTDEPLPLLHEIPELELSKRDSEIFADAIIKAEEAEEKKQ